MQTYPSGTRIGQYEIVSRPMMGGMGVVYFALDHGNDGRPVALKTFRPELLPDRAARDRFLREGTAWIELGRHPHIVRCYEVKYFDPIAFLVLELIVKEQNMPDASLRSWLIPGHPLPIEQALLFALQIARGMQHATDKIPGFVHRDLKPENILVGADKLPGTSINQLRVTDFGLIKTMADSGMPATTSKKELKPNQVQFTMGVGTPLYMAPEQWQGEPVGIFTDVYAFGCILYEMIAGKRVMQDKSVSEIQHRHIEGRLEPLPSEEPYEVTEILQQCLALSPQARYADWTQVEAALRHSYTTMIGKVPPEEKIINVQSRSEQIELGLAYMSIGVAYLDIGNPKTALKHFERARVMATEQADQELEANALNELGGAYMALGNAQRALEYHGQALAIARQNDDYALVGAALNSIGEIYRVIHDERRAIDYYKQSLITKRKIGDRHGEGSSLGNLGIACAALGEVDEAIDYLQQALAIWREIGDRRGECADLGNLGVVYMTVGDIEHAIEYAKQYLTIARQIGYRYGEGTALGNLADAYFHQGNIERAIEYAEQFVTIAHEIGDQYGEHRGLLYLGDFYLRAGNARQAIAYYEQCLGIAREILDQRKEAIDLCKLGSAFATLGETKQAILFYDQGLQVARALKDLNAITSVSMNLARLYTAQGDNTRALSFTQEVVQAFEVALEALQHTTSPSEVITTVAQYPFMLTNQFIRTIEVISEELPPNLKSSFEQRLAIIRQLAKAK